MSPLLGRPSLEGPHLLGRALLLLAALLCAAAPVSQLLEGPSWLALPLLAAAPVTLGGVVLRRVLRPQILVPLAQAGLIVVVVLAVEAALGLLDGGPAGMVTGQAEILTEGVNELASGVPPLALGPHGTVLVVALIALAALLLDLMYLDLGWHTPTALLLLGALLIPALQQPSGGTWWQVAGPVLAAGMVFATRTVHGDPRYLRGDRRPQAGPVHAPGRTLSAAALAVVLIAALTAPLAPLLPQLAPARIALNIDLLERWQDPDAQQLGAVMIDDDISVRRSLLEQQDTEVLTYTSTAEEPSYLRLRTLNSFDGETFSAQADGEEPLLGVESFSDARDDGEAVTGGNDDFVRTQLEISSLAGDRLPVPDTIRSVQGADAALNRAMTLQPTNGEVALDWVRGGLAGQRYTVESERRTSTAEELRAVDPAVFDQPVEAGYTSPDEVPEIAAELADQVAADAGAENAFDTALAFQQHFRTSYAYSLTVTTPAGEDPLESFLADRIGYCEQFAAAFALMMTSQGYPARVAIGFTPGTRGDGDEWSVTGKNAHAWPEVWFGPEHGWVRFEPTPAAAANGVREPGLTGSEGVSEDAPTAVQTPEQEGQPTQEESTDEETTTEEESSEETSAPSSDAGGAGPSEETVRRWGGGVIGLAAVGALLAGLAAVTVLLLRRHRLRARDARWAPLRSPAGSGAADGGAAADGPGAAGEPGATGGDGSGAADGGPGAPDAAVLPDLAAAHRDRRAGELAWAELERELAVRATAIRLLGATGAWGRPPAHLALDAAMPPGRALEDLLEQIAAGDREVTPAHRAAAARLAEAYTVARYAAPLPEQPGPSPQSGGTPQGGAEHPLRHDTDLLIALLRAAR